MNPKISIVVPAFNVDKYIDVCLNSLYRQTLKNIEIILVDDGSTDRTSDIISSYCDKDIRFRLLRQQNQGTSVARNLGVSNASGEYIFFVDSDDWISERACEILYHAAKKSELDILVCDYFYVIGDKVICRNSFFDSDAYTGVEYVNNALSRNSLTLPPWNKLIKRELASKIEFRPGYVHEDIEFTFMVFLKAGKVAAISDSLYFYRRFRDGSNTSEFNVCNIYNLFDIYGYIEQEFHKYPPASRILDSKYYKISKFEKLNMETLFKLIDDSHRIDNDENIISCLKHNEEFNSLLNFYLSNGMSIKHKIVAKLFRIHPKLYIFLGRTFYPLLKAMNFAA